MIDPTVNDKMRTAGLSHCPFCTSPLTTTACQTCEEMGVLSIEKIWVDDRLIYSEDAEWPKWIEEDPK